MYHTPLEANLQYECEVLWKLSVNVLSVITWRKSGPQGLFHIVLLPSQGVTSWTLYSELLNGKLAIRLLAFLRTLVTKQILNGWNRLEMSAR